jgi:hypothetical protein
MPNGARCHSPALRNMYFCYYHTRLHHLANAAASTTEQAEPLKIPILEDRSAIQVALSKIFDALGTRQIDTRAAGLYLYGLQIASQNVERKHDILPFKSVESITHTRDGDELAPELRICESSDKCATCDERDTCNAFEPEQDDAEA